MLKRKNLDIPYEGFRVSGFLGSWGDQVTGSINEFFGLESLILSHMKHSFRMKIIKNPLFWSGTKNQVSPSIQSD
jgi:hypothetical protein